MPKLEELNLDIRCLWSNIGLKRVLKHLIGLGVVLEVLVVSLDMEL